MSKQIMNMQLSQQSIGKIDEADFETGDDNVIELGFKPAVVYGILINTSDEAEHRFSWYSVDEDATYISDETAFDRETSNSFIEASENGFVLDGTKATAAAGTPTKFIYHAYGGNRIDSECPVAEEAHPDAVERDTAMDTVDYLPEL